MARLLGWNEGAPSKGGSDSADGSIFLKLKAGNTYKVRLIDKALHYHQFWEPVVCRSPFPAEDGTITCPLKLQGLEPKDRYAIWVFDRNDGNKIKLMDYPPSLHGKFKQWFEATNHNPGGENGPDWSITLTAPQGKQQFTKYEAMPLDRTPFKEEELKQMANAKLKERLLDLRRDNTPEEIRQMLRTKKDPSSSGSEPSRVQSKPESKPESKPKQKAPIVDIEDAIEEAPGDDSSASEPSGSKDFDSLDF